MKMPSEKSAEHRQREFALEHVFNAVFILDKVIGEIHNIRRDLEENLSPEEITLHHLDEADKSVDHLESLPRPFENAVMEEVSVLRAAINRARRHIHAQVHKKRSSRT